jgi:D-glycero-D-manno-heptose 1,7-bisphosphate phosphatase
MGIDRAVRRAVFLDRDGVINRATVRGGKPYPPASEDAFEILPDVHDALARLHDAGFHLVVVTNQPDISRGVQRREVVDRMHARLRAELPIDDIRVCDHDDADRCSCRKPQSGLLEAAAHDAGLSLADSFMVGDRWRDVEAGRRAGCTTVFVDRQYDEPRPDRPAVTVRSLGEAADWILSRSRIEHS